MNTSNPIVLVGQNQIGKLAAEFDDEYLFSCFVNTKFHDEVASHNSPKMILSGRTGSGKSAVIRYICHQNPNSKQIDLQSMSMDYIANSDVVNFLIALDVDVDLLFQALWKHVLCIELIRMIYQVKNQEESRWVISRWIENFSRDGRKKRAIDYLENWQSKFWIDMDENLREVTENIENRVTAEFGSELDSFKGNAGFGRTISKEKKSQLQSRLRKIVNGDQLAELSRVLDLIKEAVGEKGERYYILFDGLDENWADKSIKHRLISALIEVIKSFRKIQALKIVVSIRVDLLEQTLKTSPPIGFQRDKFGDIQQSIRWNRDQMYELVNSRISKMFQRKYSKQKVEFYDVFVKKVGQVTTFDYLLSKTLMRPREILDFSNRCIEQADGLEKITANVIRKAEVNYSIVRLQSIVDEWKSLYPSIDKVLVAFKGIRKNLSFRDFTDGQRLDTIIEKIFEAGEHESCPIQKGVNAYLSEEEGTGKDSVAKRIVEMLYRVGVLGIKRSENMAMQWSDGESSIVIFEELADNFRMQFHSTFDQSLNLNTNR